MYHSLIIGEKNTWLDWYLIPSSRPVVSPPKPDYYMVEVPGASGSIDLTEALNGEITYRDREGSWEFYVDNDHEEWDVLYTTILNYVHGKKFTIYLEDEEKYYYKGRVSVNEWRSDPNYSKIIFDYIIEPYKYILNLEREDWEWDPFDFTSSVIYEKYIQVEGSRDFTIKVESKPIIPVVFTPDQGMSIEFDGNTYSIPANQETKMYDVFLTEGTQTFTIKGNGSIEVNYKNGVL